METVTGMAVYQPAASPTLAGALNGLANDIHNAALADLELALAGDNGWSETEKEAVLVIQELKLVNGVDLAAILMRGKFLKQIAEHNLCANHPNGYRNEGDMAKAQGISWTALQQAKDLYNIVFPYVTDVLGMSLPAVWEEIGKSNFVELIPVIKRILGVEGPVAATVVEATNRILDDVAATARAAGQDPTDEEIRRTAIELLLQDGAHLNNADMRRRVRPTHTANVSTSIITIGTRRLLVSDIETEDQWAMINRLVGSHLDITSVELPADPRQRQVEAARVPELRTLLRLLEG